ncbi:hypothetical protein AB0I28_28490 [Phytomonospora sp. NPDC050363]|uniref:hypothetical protein n=1 Tax=Phytomonospora sp. NPDC050363 TaxID=3155642 RepID=UPI0033F7A3CF
MRSHDRNSWPVSARWTAAPAVVVLLLLTGCTENGPETPESTALPSASVVPSDRPLKPGCLAWADPPTSGTLEVYKTWLEYDPGFDAIVNWNIILYNSSELMAVDATITPKFTLDGKDVTDEIEHKDYGPFGSFIGSYRPHENVDLDGPLTAPQDWKRRVEFTATVVADYWCHPAPKSS